MNVDSDIVNYYVAQVGGANGIYSGAVYQRGHGIGGFLASLFKSCLPILKSRGLSVGKTLLSTGIDMMGDMQNNSSFRNAYQNRRDEAFQNIRNNIISGNGYNGTRKRKASQSSLTSCLNNLAKRVKKAAKKKPTKKRKAPKKKTKLTKKQLKDIFS
jgi:hypothetical protein